ncbi:hypothetical protein [Streptacidiphilus cavernicola]|uniref:Uncharacterized protein n=1 Tax=Streptacidiphilus cavernicola TaxID=3342716 RepID=A0ABV6W2F2_9ACTN
MTTATFNEPTANEPTATAPTVTEPPQIRPLPAWFFAFEGLFGGTYDVLRVNPNAWMFLVALALVNITVSLTVLGKRRKLIRAMLKNSRTRYIAIGLVALRVLVHLALGALGAQVTTAAGHLAVAFVMTGVTVGLLWFDQRVTFRALGIPLNR